jgi:hypothetical protein
MSLLAKKILASQKQCCSIGFIGWLVCWFFGWLVGWLIDWLLVV